MNGLDYPKTCSVKGYTAEQIENMRKSRQDSIIRELHQIDYPPTPCQCQPESTPKVEVHYYRDDGFDAGLIVAGVFVGILIAVLAFYFLMSL